MKKLYETIQELQKLYETSTVINSTVKLKEVLTKILETIIDDLEAETGSLMLINEETKKLYIEVAKGIDERIIKTVSLNLGEKIAGWVAKYGEPILLLNSTPDPRFKEMMKRKNIKSALCVPLKIRNKVFGIISVNRKQIDDFTENHLTLLSILTTQAAMIVENARLSIRIEAKIDELSKLNNLGWKLNTVFTIEQISTLTALSTKELVGFDVFTLLSIEEDTISLDIRSCVPLSDALIQTVKDYVLKEASTLISDELSNKIKLDLKLVPGYTSKQKKLLDAVVKSHLTVPLIQKNNIIGLLSICSFQPDFFTEDNLRILLVLASHVAIAIENVQLHCNVEREIEQRTKEIQKLFSKIDKSLIKVEKEIMSPSLSEKLLEKNIDSLQGVLHEVTLSLNNAKLQDALRKKVEIINEQKHNLDSIIDSMSDGILVLDKNQHVIIINKTAERFLNVKEEQVLGKKLMTLTSEAKEINSIIKQLELDTELEKRLKTAGRVKTAEITLGEKILEVNSSFIIDDRNSYLGEVFTLHDVTKEKELDKMKSEFVSMASHELRTPLTSIRAYSEVLMDDPYSKNAKEYLEIINDESERLTRLLNETLTLSKIESGVILPRKTPVQLADLIEHNLEIVKKMAEGNRVKLNKIIPRDIPLIMVDEDMINEVMMNLLSNALRYSPDGGVVTVTIRPTPTYIEVTIADTGLGIAKEEQEKIFDKFYRSNDKRVRAIGGTGLGLPIVKTQIEKHDGKIWVESEYGKGSKFTFQLPRVAGGVEE